MLKPAVRRAGVSCGRWRCFCCWQPELASGYGGPGRRCCCKARSGQRALNVELSRLLQAVAENPAAAGLSLLGFSFAYGVLHALGPGHGKVVITTWLATHPSKLKSSIGLTLAASLLQGLVAIALVVVVLTLLQLPARQLHLSSFWLEKGSYLLVGALGLLLCWRALKKLRILLRRPKFTAFTAHHVHHASCGCGHQHLPAPERLQSGDGPGGPAGYRAVNGDAALFRGHYGAAVQ